MTTNGSPLADALIQGWKEYHEQLVVTIQQLTAEQLTARVTPDLREVSEIIAHVISARANWFGEILGEVLREGDREIAELAQWENEGQPVRTAAAYAHALTVTWQLMEQAIARWTEADLQETIVLPWIGPKYPIARPFVVWHIIEHDLHHGGEITQTLGLLGLQVYLPPPPPKS